MYGKETLYNVLDIPRSASAADVRRAYKKLVEEMRQEGTLPDPRRQALLHEAFEVLSDPRKRAAYNESLGDPGFLAHQERRRFNVKHAGIAAGVVAAAMLGYFILRPAAGTAGGTKELLDGASLSTGRLQSIAVSGRLSPVSFAVTTEEGVMMTTCHGIPAGTQLVVNNGQSSIGARVSIADTELDLCKLAMDGGGGSTPMRMSAMAPKAGDKVHTLVANAAGEFELQQGTVKGTVPGPRGAAIEITIPIAPGSSGGPLFDARGQLIGITTAPHAYGDGRHVALPASWISQVRGRAAKK